MNDAERHALQMDFDSVIERINECDALPPPEKDVLRQLISGAYRNTNGDPTEQKISMLSISVYGLAKTSVSDHILLLKIFQKLEEHTARFEARQAAALASLKSGPNLQGWKAALWAFRWPLSVVVCVALLALPGDALREIVAAVAAKFGG